MFDDGEVITKSSGVVPPQWPSFVLPAAEETMEVSAQQIENLASRPALAAKVVPVPHAVMTERKREGAAPVA